MNQAVSEIKPLSLGEICFLEPQVAEILRRDRYARRGDRWAYEAFKRDLSQHVGWFAPLPSLQSSAVYDLTINAMVNTMGTVRRAAK